MSATYSLNSTSSFAPVLYVAFELSSGQWKLASTTARGQRTRVASVQARNTAAVLRKIARAKTRFGVPESAVVFSCYEAGRDGFWGHRCYRVDPQKREPIPHVMGIALERRQRPAVVGGVVIARESRPGRQENGRFGSP
jgi:transposase